MIQLIKMSIILLCTNLIFLCGCYPPLIIDEISEINNGGGSVILTKPEEELEHYLDCQSGSTFAFWNDAIFKQMYGPTYSNVVKTKISNELITQISFEGVKYSNDTQLLKSFSNNEELIDYLESSHTVIQIDFKKLVDLFMINNLNSNQRILDFLKYLLQQNIISNEEYAKLLDELNSNGLDINGSIDQLVNYLSNRHTLVNVLASELLSITNTSNLKQGISLQDLRLKFESMGIDIATITGDPRIILTKSVDRQTTWYNAILIYTIIFENKGQITARDLEIIDIIPSTVQFQRFTEGSHSTSYDIIKKTTKGGEILRFRIRDPIKSGEKGFISFKVKIGDLKK